MRYETAHYFVCANSAQGFVNYFDSNLAGLERLFILKGGPGSGKSTLMKNLAQSFGTSGYAVDYLHCSSDPESLDGVLIPAIKAAVVDGTAPHVIEPIAPGAIEDYVNMGVALNHELLMQSKSEILAQKARIKQSYDAAYQQLAVGKKIYDQWVEDDSKALATVQNEALSEQLLVEIFAETMLLKKSRIQHRFLGANSAEGSVNYLENLLNPPSKRYFIQGRPGNGQSALLKKVVATAEVMGYDAEVYHCCFDPDSYELLILRELDVCLLDATAPHAVLADRKSDVVLELDNTVTGDPNEQFGEESVQNFKLTMQQATACLAEAKAGHLALEEIYRPAVDFEVVDQISEAMKAELFNMTI